ncbi:ABC transporter permease [Solidesulfovibrio sp.]|uniref:ABC transporter permease n=1 Tax=Solidesulfovibrio sp. TaxID=2910990 RepID=UPI0026158156|nr:ABC transporter permease [Solidesulfovibrio sp.]
MPKPLSENAHATVIEAGHLAKDYWRDMWQHREFLQELILRDLRVRYKQTLIGVAWVALRPLVTLLIFSFVFGTVASMASNGLPYPLLVFAGMLPWTLFSNIVIDVSNSILGNSSIVGKIYFPRLLVPCAAVGINLVDYAVSCLLFMLFAMASGVFNGRGLFLLPLLTLWTVLLAFGFGLWGAALNVRYRDFRHLVPFLLQIGIYISPVGYSATLVPERFKILYSLNPMVGIIDMFRWSQLGSASQVYLPGMFVSIGVTIFFLWTGLRYFRKVETMFVDYL